MMPPWNTPTGGDFVRHIERLSAAKALPEPKIRLPASGQASARAVSSRAIGGFRALQVVIESSTKFARRIAVLTAKFP